MEILEVVVVKKWEGELMKDRRGCFVILGVNIKLNFLNVMVVIVFKVVWFFMVVFSSFRVGRENVYLEFF